MSSAVTFEQPAGKKKLRNEYWIILQRRPLFFILAYVFAVASFYWSSSVPVPPSPHRNSPYCHLSKVSNASIKLTSISCIKTAIFKICKIRESENKICVFFGWGRGHFPMNQRGAQQRERFWEQAVGYSQVKFGQICNISLSHHVCDETLPLPSFCFFY